ncbi:MAG: metal-sensitive transcriptional regulator [Planctomycetes bacterium]|nr:metal-sensitive transcriptional regulator [Planctomycetota bacterium]
MEKDVRKAIGRRLKIIEGQVRGVERLLDEDVYCVDVLTQVAAIQNALRGVSKAVVDNHLRTCFRENERKGNDDTHIDELLEIMTKLNK